MEYLTGKQQWALPDLYWPAADNGCDYVSHEAICVLNTSGLTADIRLTLFYEDREPINISGLSCPPMRTNHIRMDKLRDSRGNPLPRGVGYSAVLCATAPVIVQYTRVDTTQPALALMTTMAYGI